MAKKTKKMALGGAAGPMNSRPAMQGSGNSKAGSGQSVKQDGNRPDGQFGPMRGNDRGNERGGRGRGGRDDGSGMVRPGFPSRPGGPFVSGPGKPNTSIGPMDPQRKAQRDLEASVATRYYGAAPTGGTQTAVQAPAGVPFKAGATFDPSLANSAPVGGQTRSAASGPRPMDNPAMIRFASPEASADYIKRYNESMAATGGKQYNPGYAKGGAVKPKKMASGGMAKSSSGGRGWGKARGSKSAKVC